MFCVDVHHHYFPPDLKLDKQATNQTLGWKSPDGVLDWSPELSLRAMDVAGVDVSILSFPAISQGQPGSANRHETRKRNIYVADICKRYPDRFGFFASLPFLDDVEGCLAEIAFAFDSVKADGVAISSSYGEGQEAKYVGHEHYSEIWNELNKRRAVVFLHGTQTPSSTPVPHPWLGVPITEVGNETFKAAAHLVVTGRKRSYPDVKIILSHMGGTLPILACRVAVLSNYMGCNLTPNEMLDDFKTFYFETALSAYGPNLQSIEAFALPDHLLFGTDLPAISNKSAQWFTSQLNEHYALDTLRLKKVMHENALKLFPNKRPSVT
ncbi:amidohydrolase 2 [Coprinopsis marcescibilis]|uniref:6-methylsalicylate decarboxylase n=1 Tax=Coprinopsis marcescibilis TaxID=230819 RepID=A0A5C3LL85_COPMA|nr:amidohydrolase 2 [Coprinopsis marcescibilis]